MSPANRRMITVLHPNYGKDRNGKPIPSNRRDDPVLSDYISVPAISLYGTEKIRKLLPHKSVLALAALTNTLANKR